MSPLQLIIFRNPDDEKSMAYENAIYNAFTGHRTGGEYHMEGDDLGIQLQCFSDVPLKSVKAYIETFRHTQIIVLADSSLLNKGEPLWTWLSNAWLYIDELGDAHSIILVMMDEPVADAIVRQYPNLRTTQFLQIHRLGEKPIRPPVLALQVLHQSRLLLARRSSSQGGHLRLFISHSKHDGLPLAHAIKRQIDSFEWLQSFYDVDIPVGSNWEKELKKGVESSLLIVLRTDTYDERPSCQNEVQWAEEHATPVVLVEARTGLQYPASTLPFDRFPTIRIPDGNLLRVLFLALREGLRSLYFVCRAEETFSEMRKSGLLPKELELKVIPFQPNMLALNQACEYFINKNVAGIIVYPDPVLSMGLYDSALNLIEKRCPGTRLVTLNNLAASFK